MSSAMSAEQREAFLAETHVGVISVAREGRGPHAVPVWYGYEPGGEVVVWTTRGSVKERLIRAAGRFTLAVQVEQRPYRYVTVEGPVTGWIEEPTAEQVVAIASRYLEPERAQKYVEGALTPTAVIVRMKPEHWVSAAFEDL